jgi:glycosyltransferase involved in cell wall biosynthesis
MSQQATRVLHVVGGLDRGGIETFLMHVLRRRERERLAMDFLAHSHAGAYDEEVLALGSRIFRCPYTTQPAKYAAEFRRIMRERGPFDIIHSHVHHFDGYVMRLAYRAGITVRIAHSHNDTSARDARAGFARRFYLRQMERAIARHATLGIACSRLAAASLFGANWQSDPRWKLLPYGIDLTPFDEPADCNALRSKLGVAPDALLAIHVGRFDHQKNHPFLIRIAAAMAAREPKFRLLLLGKGELQPQIEAQVRELGLQEKVIFAGSRPDVPHCLRAADVFVMPSFHEGLPLAGLEAQAAGLPFVVADTVTPEIAVVPELVQFLALERTAEEWAHTALQAARESARLPRAQALAAMKQSSCNIENSVAGLEKIYHDAVGRAGADGTGVPSLA